jgi:ribosomal protein L37AE/L43A
MEQENKKTQTEDLHEETLEKVAGGNTDYRKCPICEEVAFKSSSRIGGGQCTSCGYNPDFQKCPECGKWRLHVLPGGLGSCYECNYKV